MSKLLVLFVAAFVDMVGITMIVPLLPFYATRFGASGTLVGLLISAFSIAQLLSAPAWGRMSDRLGRRPAILTGLLLSAAAYLIFAFADSLLLLLACRVVQGLGGGTIGVVQAYVADASDPKDRAKALGWLSAITSLGAVAGPAQGSLLAHAIGPTAPGIGSAALCVVTALFAWRYLRESHALRAPSGRFARPSPRTGREAVWHVLTRSGEPAPRLIWIYTICIGAFYGTAQIFPLLVKDRLGVTEQNVGYFVMYLGAMGVIVRAGLLGSMIDWLGEARLCRVGLVLLAAGLSLFAFVHSYPVLWTSLTLMPLGTAFVFPCVTGLLSQVVASNERGLFLGVQQTFGGASRVAFPIMAGVMIDHLGVGTPFWVSGLLVLAALALTGRMESYADARPPAPATAG
jgi:MFS family permease